jgi:hypothetical protein
MLLSGPHAVPGLVLASVIVCGAPPARASRLILPLEKNPIDAESGDQNGLVAPSVPWSGRAAVVSSGLSQSIDCPLPAATNTR